MTHGFWKPAHDQVVRVVDHFTQFVVIDRTVELDGIPMTLVQVIARTNGRVACAPLQSESRVALETDVTGVSVQRDEGEDAAADLEYGEAISERILFRSSGKTGA